MWKLSDLYPNYEVSDQGEVRNAKTKRLLNMMLVILNQR